MDERDRQIAQRCENLEASPERRRERSSPKMPRGCVQAVLNVLVAAQERQDAFGAGLGGGRWW